MNARERRQRDTMQQLVANDAVEDFADDVAADFRAADMELAALRASHALQVAEVTKMATEAANLIQENTRMREALEGLVRRGCIATTRKCVTQQKCSACLAEAALTPSPRDGG